MNNRVILLAALLAVAAPLAAQSPTPIAAAESKAEHSIVSLAVEPKLDDGRLVIKLAAQNRSSDAVAFGPSNVTVQTLAGQPIAITPLQRLVNDVRIAAGMAQLGPSGSRNNYSTEQVNTDATGRMDVSNYRGSMGISGDEGIRQSGRTAKPTITRKEAAQQIDALKQGILQDSSVAAGAVVAGQLVTAPINLKKGEDRTLHIWVKIAGDEHSFTIAAPAS